MMIQVQRSLIVDGDNKLLMTDHAVMLGSVTRGSNCCSLIRVIDLHFMASGLRKGKLLSHRIVFMLLNIKTDEFRECSNSTGSAYIITLFNVSSLVIIVRQLFSVF